MKSYFIIDFDSTFITGETLEWLAEIVLRDLQSEKWKIVLQKINKITNLSMNGKISFEDSLWKRLTLFQAHRNHIEQLIQRISTSVTPSFARNRDFIQKNANIIKIVSGGFHEYMDPILKSFGIPQENIFGNTFLFEDGKVVGFDTENPLSKSKGKVEIVKAMNLEGKVIVIGDGYTDYEIVKEGVGNIFIAFTENIKRGFIDEIKPISVNSFEGIIEYLLINNGERRV